MSYVRGWRAWYADGSEFSSETHNILQLPTTGLQIIMLYFRDGTRRIIESSDRVFWQDNGSDDGIFGQTDDPASDITARYPGAHIIEGSQIDDTSFRSFEAAAMNRKDP